MPSNLIRRAHQKNIFTSTWGHFFLVSFLPPSLTGRGLSWLKQCSHILWLFCDCNNQITQISNQCRGSCYSQADAFKVCFLIVFLAGEEFLVCWNGKAEWTLYHGPDGGRIHCQCLLRPVTATWHLILDYQPIREEYSNNWPIRAQHCISYHLSLKSAETDMYVQCQQWKITILNV